MTYHWISDKSNTTGSISGAETAKSSEALALILVGFMLHNL
jgi:hypothetical protein